MDLEEIKRFIQIAFNNTAGQVRRLLPNIPKDRRIIIEAGTPFIKREGIAGVRLIRRYWPGLVVADLKVLDGAYQEVMYARAAGASAVTAAGSAPVETLDIFVGTCKAAGMYSMIDMLGVDNPLRKLMALKARPNFVVIHKGRDEERNPRSMIRYKDINKIRSKYSTLISVAGGLDAEKVRSAFFNGADVAILNVVFDNSGMTKGLPQNANIRPIITGILKEIGK
ncbi:hypothetical protein GF325_13500 [Candidatus Bathyarchaeota archaeon]|nr:hypothetical protein [Candidatus Bathyarchaeota archaeon]